MPGGQVIGRLRRSKLQEKRELQGPHPGAQEIRGRQLRIAYYIVCTDLPTYACS